MLGNEPLWLAHHQKKPKFETLDTYPVEVCSPNIELSWRERSHREWWSGVKIVGWYSVNISLTHTPQIKGTYKSPFQFGSLLECSDKFFQVSSRKIWSGMEWSWNLANLLGKVTVSFRWLPGQPGAVPEHNGQLQYCWFGATPLIHNLWIPASFFSLCILTHFTKQNVPPKLQYNFCFCGRCVHHTWR